MNGLALGGDLPRTPADKKSGVFVVMPFNASHSKWLWRIVARACKNCGLPVCRADKILGARPILNDIFEAINKAEIVVADLTGLNANVLYEVGVSHTRRKKVVFLCQSGQQVPFNLAPFRTIDFHVRKGQAERELEARLADMLDYLRSVGPPAVIRSRVKRTEIVIRDLERLAALPDGKLRKQTVWLSGALTAFAISENEQFAAEDRVYGQLLLKERDLLLSLTRRGCLCRSIITPPKVGPKTVRYLGPRARHLYDFLCSKDRALESIDWAVSPFRQKNLYIIGDLSSIEGYKKADERGFPLSLRLTGQEAISVYTSLYEALFDHLAEYSLRTYCPKRRKITREALREAARSCLETRVPGLRRRSARNQTKQA